MPTVDKLEAGARLILEKHQVPFVTRQDWAGRWPKDKIRADALAALGFLAGKNGCDEDSSVLASLA